MLSELLRLTRQGEPVGERSDVDPADVARSTWSDCELDSATLGVAASRTLSRISLVGTESHPYVEGMFLIGFGF